MSAKIEKIFPAFASIEFESVPVGIFAADALLKKSPISLIRSGTNGRGRFLVFIAGSTASVEEAYEEALFHGEGYILDSAFLPDIHEQVYCAVLGEIRQQGAGAILAVETPTVSCCIEAAERALKGTPVTLLEFRAGDPRMGGKGFFLLQGDLTDIEAAKELAAEFLSARNISATYRLLTSPSEFMVQQLFSTTRFNKASALELDGEIPAE